MPYMNRVYTHTHPHPHAPTHASTHARTYTHMHIHTHTHTHIRTRTNAYPHVLVFCMHNRDSNESWWQWRFLTNAIERVFRITQPIYGTASKSRTDTDLCTSRPNSHKTLQTIHLTHTSDGWWKFLVIAHVCPDRHQRAIAVSADKNHTYNTHTHTQRAINPLSIYGSDGPERRKKSLNLLCWLIDTDKVAWFSRRFASKTN